MNRRQRDSGPSWLVLVDRRRTLRRLASRGVRPLPLQRAARL